MDPIYHFARHVVDTNYDDLPNAAIESAKTFLLDTLGVGVAGSSGPFTAELLDTQVLSAPGEQARVWADGRRLSAAGAALCNSYQIHNCEFDCVHEAAVVHTMTVPTAAALAYAEREGNVSGEALLTALVLGVDIACHLGVASTAPLKFFRPATAGAFGATAAIGKLMGFDEATLVNAFGATHSQLCGTMQAHTEGSIALALQIGFNARNAVLACDLAAHGLDAPKNILEGPFGYFPLFEGEHHIQPVLDELGRLWRITEVAHKPFPSGRATHGIIDAALQLKSELGFGYEAVERIDASVPRLVHHLVGRPIHDAMTLNYARLCAQFAVARAIQSDGLTVADFADSALRDPSSLAFGSRVHLEVDANPDPNALTPVKVTVTLRDGSTHEKTVTHVYGNPLRPMTREAQIEKLKSNWKSAKCALPADNAERLIAQIDDLESLNDVRLLIDNLVPAD